MHGGPLASGGPSAKGLSTAFHLAPLINPQIFAAMQFEGPPLLHTRALHAALEGIGYLHEERLPPAERPGQHDLSTVAYLQIAAEIPPDRIIVLNLEEFQRLVSATLTDLYPMFARYAAPRNIIVGRLLEISHLVIRDPTNILSREPPAPQLPVHSSLLASAHPLPQPAEVYESLQLIASKFAEASASTKPPPADTCRRLACSLDCCAQRPRLTTAFDFRIDGLWRLGATFGFCCDQRRGSPTDSDFLACSNT